MDFNWGAFTLFLYIMLRMSGFVLVSPVFGRTGVPDIFKSAYILLLTIVVYSMQGDVSRVPVPDTILELAFRFFTELLVGGALAYVMRFFLLIPEQAGEVIDTQMGLSMARTYDASSQASVTITASLLNTMMLMLFFVAGGHLTLLRIIATSGELVPYGAATFSAGVANRMVELFLNCMLLAIKLCLPILAAELLGQVGMGVLMKVIPQINVFAINIEIKVIVGLVMLLLLLGPFSDFLLETENRMLREINLLLDLMHT